MSEFWDHVWGTVGKPYSSADAFIDAATLGFRQFFSWDSKTSVFYIASSIVLAVILYYLFFRKNENIERKGLLNYLVPRDVYLHRSAIIDYKFVFIDTALKFLLYVPLITGFAWLLEKSVRPYSFRLPVEFIQNTSYTFRVALVTVLAFLMADFVFFFGHYVLHKVPWLWHFHEVHHSAEVLTPITVSRFHPVEEIVNALVSPIVTILLAKTYEAISDGGTIAPFTILGVNIFFFMFFSIGFQLRHSHIFVSWGKYVSHILISPAQHQVHHSLDRKHWNKNFGYTLAIWDWMFRTLYVPEKYEKIDFGVPNVDQNDFSTVAKLYYLPFVKTWRRIVYTLKTGETAFGIDWELSELKRKGLADDGLAVGSVAEPAAVRHAAAK